MLTAAIFIGRDSFDAETSQDIATAVKKAATLQKTMRDERKKGVKLQIAGSRG
jgi:hypothetical protein